MDLLSFHVPGAREAAAHRVPGCTYITSLLFFSGKSVCHLCLNLVVEQTVLLHLYVYKQPFSWKALSPCGFLYMYTIHC